MKIQARSKTAQGHFRCGKFLGNAWQEMEVTQKELAMIKNDAGIEWRKIDDSLNTSPVKAESSHKEFSHDAYDIEGDE